MKKGLEAGTEPAMDAPSWRRVASAINDVSEVDDNAAAVPRVLRALLTKIDAGEYQPGQKINTVELASSLQLSRAPIREALHILAGRGIVQLLPDRGAVLRPYSKQRMIDSLQVLGSLFEFVLKTTAERIDEGDNRNIVRGHQQKIAEAAANPQDFQFWLCIHDFLHDLCQISDNHTIEEIILSLNLDLHAREFEKYLPVAEHVVQYGRTFQRMTEALISGDGQSAAAIGAYHIDMQVRLLQEASG